MRQFFTGREGWWERNKLRAIGEMDQLVITNLWRAVKEEMPGAPLSEIAERTEQLVDRTQPTWDILTTSSLARESRQSLFSKLATLFSSQRNKNWNMGRRAIATYRYEKIKSDGKATTAAKVRLAQTIATVIALQSASIYLIKQGADIVYYGYDRVRRKKFLEHMLGMTKRVLGNWLIVGDAIDAALSAAMAKSPAFVGGNQNPLSQAMDDVYQTVTHIKNGISHSATNKRYGARGGYEKMWPKDLWRAADKAVRAAGILTGIPFGGLSQMWSAAKTAFKKAG